MIRYARIFGVQVAILSIGLGTQSAAESISDPDRSEIVHAPIVFSNLAISPDGTTIAFTHTDGWHRDTVVEVAVDDSDRITRHDHGCLFAVSDPSYSPDGQFMAMKLSERRFLLGPPKSILATDFLLVLVREPMVEILRARDPIFENFEAPTFSTDSQRIAFVGEMFVDSAADRIRPDSVRLYDLKNLTFKPAFDGDQGLNIVGLAGVDGGIAMFDAVAELEDLAPDDRALIRSLDAQPGPSNIFLFETTADAGHARLIPFYPAFVESENDFGISARVSLQYGAYYGVLLLPEQPQGASVWQYGIYRIGPEGRTPVLDDGMFIYDMAVSADESRIAVIHARGASEPNVYSMEQTISIFDRTADGGWTETSLEPVLARIPTTRECFPEGLPWK